MTDTNSNTGVIPDAKGGGLSACIGEDGKSVSLHYNGRVFLRLAPEEVPEVIIQITAAALEAGLNNAKLDKPLDYLMDVMGGGDDD